MLWNALMTVGQSLGLVPVGLAARDTLRLEMGYVLYGHELNLEISPWEAGLAWVIKMDGDDFVGREALAQQKAAGISRKISGILMEDPGIPREGMSVFAGDRGIGKVVSGTMSPMLKKGIATALLDSDGIPASGEIFVDIRGKMKKSKLHKPPFIKQD